MMTLSTLIKKGRLANRMAATVATQEVDQPVTVAVAKQPEPLPRTITGNGGIRRNRYGCSLSSYCLRWL